MLLLFSQAIQDFRMQKVQIFQEDKSLPKQKRKPQRVVTGQTTRPCRLNSKLSNTASIVVPQ